MWYAVLMEIIIGQLSDGMWEPLTKGTIFLPTVSQRMLWEHEIIGQLSDGMWENSRPYEHYKFWYNLDCKAGPPRVEVGQHDRCLKKNYNLISLISVVMNRMMVLGRMGKAGICADNWKIRNLYDTLTNDPDATIPGEQFALLDLEEVQRYFKTEYTVKDLKTDLRVIRQAMETAPKW